MESMKMKMLLLIALLGLGTQVKAVDILSVAGIDATNSANSATLSAMGVSYNSNSKRLILNNATIVATGTTPGIATNLTGLTIRVSGISTITAENAPAITLQGGVLSITSTGSGTLYAKGKSGMYISGTSGTLGVLISNGTEVTLEATNGAAIYGDYTLVGKNIYTYYAGVSVQDAATSLILKGTTAAVADVNTFEMTNVAIQYPSGVSFAKPRINTTNWVHITGQGLPINATNFPDATFRTYVANYDIHQDGYLSRYERSLVTSMNVSNQGIADMTGIGNFTKLTTFNCSGNTALTSLDLSANTQLTTLNIDGCTSLTSLKAFGHVLELVGATEPTCTTSGNEEHWYCTHCDTYYFDASRTQPTTLEGVTIPALGHVLEHVEGVAVTCTTDGRLEYWYCTRCGNYYLDAACTETTTLADTHIPALGHNLEYIEAAAPTCTTNGNMEYWHCVRCGNYYHDGICTELTTSADVTIPALGHELEHVEAVEPTCTANGNLEYWHCTRCGYYLDAECTQSTTLAGVTIPALGHDFDEEHFCNRCGKGEPAELVDGYYQIRYPGNLYWFAEYVNDGNRNVNAKLVDDITINTNVVAANGSNNGFRVWTPIGSATANSYQGIFDGQQHTVSGLYRVSNNYTGLFGCISGATIKNVTIADSYFRGSSYISFICGSAAGDGNTIRNCHTDGKLFATYQYGGGICGYFEGGRISGCTNSGTLSGNYSDSNGKYLGGICGYTSNNNYTRTIEDCSNSGSIRQDYNMAQYFSVGGICGNAQFATITRCSNSGEIVQYSPSTGSPSRYAGGICGYFYNGTITDCYNMGTVKSNDKDQTNMGGICGYMWGIGSITNSYNVGTVSGYSYVGSICGSLTANCTVSNCFYLVNSARSNMRYGMSNAGVYQYGIGCQSYSQNLADVEGQTTSATSTEFASGSICYALNDSTSNGDLAWFQTLGTDVTPLFEGQMVYYDRSQNIYTNTQPIIIRGDMNNDGVLTTADVIVLVNYLLGLPTDGVTYDDDIADVDGNGTPSIADVTELVNQIQEAQEQ